MKIVRSSSQECVYICMYKVYIFDCLKICFNGIVERFTSHEYISIESLIKHERDISKKLFRDNHTPSPTTLLPFHDSETILTSLNRI